MSARAESILVVENKTLAAYLKRQAAFLLIKKKRWVKLKYGSKKNKSRGTRD